MSNLFFDLNENPLDKLSNWSEEIPKSNIIASNFLVEEQSKF